MHNNWPSPRLQHKHTCPQLSIVCLPFMHPLTKILVISWKLIELNWTEGRSSSSRATCLHLLLTIHLSLSLSPISWYWHWLSLPISVAAQIHIRILFSIPNSIQTLDWYQSSSTSSYNRRSLVGGTHNPPHPLPNPSLGHPWSLCIVYPDSADWLADSSAGLRSVGCFG